MGLEVLEELLQPSPVRENADLARIPSFFEVGTGYRPGRSSGLSLMVHLCALLLIVVSSTRFAYVHAAELVPPRLEPMKVDPLFLPTLGGGSEGAGEQGGGTGSTQEASNGLRARSRRGFAYPGPQPLVSAPPMAKLGIQTILRPNLKNPPILHENFPLPNLAIAPAPTPEPPKPVMKVESGRLAIRPVEKPVQAPKLKLPSDAVGSMPELAEAEPTMPQAPPPKAVPPPAKTADVPVSGRDKQGLLVLNAIPPPPDVLAKVPLGEQRSFFAVAPGDTTIIADPATGTKGGGASSRASGNGVPSDNPTGDAIAELAAGGGNGEASIGSGSGNGHKYGGGAGNGLNPVAVGAGSGRGSSSGSGTGGAPGGALGSGMGSGSAPGGGGFPGISVRGGSYGNPAAASIHTNVIARTQTSYGMTVTSTASSGGGLADFGVFHNEKVYTVYLDMRSTEDDPAPSWTLQYAMLQSSDPSEIRLVGVPSPPYATLKQLPELTPELATACAHKLIIVSAVLNKSGRLEQISVKKVPDARVNTLVTDALENWTFQPSQINGNPVTLKVLLGIRLVAR